MSDIVERLREYADDDHERGCAGRCYDCSCGYDGKRDPLLKEAAAEIERLRADLRLAVMSDSETCKVLEREVERLLKSRNRWAKKYNDLLAKHRTEGGR